MCADCRRIVGGSIYCAEHAPISPPTAGFLPPSPPSPPVPPSASPYAADGRSYDPGSHPIVALLLGFIPGVGAIYNGQYAKGLIHAVIFGILVSLANRSYGMAPLFGIMIAGWVFYMAFEAFHTARKRRYGIVTEEFSSLFDAGTESKFAGGGIVLIILGVVLLLDTTDIINLDQLERYWPVLLIALGAYLLYIRVRGTGLNHERSDNE